MFVMKWEKRDWTGTRNACKDFCQKGMGKLSIS